MVTGPAPELVRTSRKLIHLGDYTRDMSLKAFDSRSESWLRTEAGATYDALKTDSSRATPAENAGDRFESKWATRS